PRGPRSSSRTASTPPRPPPPTCRRDVRAQSYGCPSYFVPGHIPPDRTDDIAAYMWLGSHPNDGGACALRGTAGTTSWTPAGGWPFLRLNSPHCGDVPEIDEKFHDGLRQDISASAITGRHAAGHTGRSNASRPKTGRRRFTFRSGC